VRIGIDMLAAQSPHHGHRGIGRYCVNLVSAMLARDDEHEYVFYVHDDLPDTRVPTSPRASMRLIRPRWHQGQTMTPYMDSLARRNPDDLDALVVVSPFEKWCLYGPPAKPDNGLKMAAVVHDLIPFLFQNEAESDPVLTRHYRVLEDLKRYDVLLSNSEATRQDFLRVLQLPPKQVVTIGAGSDPTFFHPDPVQPISPARAEELAALGIHKPFLFNVGGLDPRKNTWNLIDAFAMLPESVRRSHQLVLTFWISYWGERQIQDHIEGMDLEDALVITGEVSDDALKLMYQRCEAFVFPSSYEGFGLPLLEAMHCGAPVIAGNNSSQIEVVGQAGMLVEVNDVSDLSAKLCRVLTEPDLNRSMRERSLEQATRFSWRKAAETALEALAAPAVPRPSRRWRFDAGHVQKPTIAFFSPFPPRKSGISDYSAHLIAELARTYRIDLYHDSGYVPEPALGSEEFMAADYGLFERIAAAKDYHAIVYQMGNSRYHEFMYPIMLKHPGVVTLHDFCLAGFHIHYGTSRKRGLSFLCDEIAQWHPESRDELERASQSWLTNWEAISHECARQGWTLNRRILDRSRVTIVHSPWCARQVELHSPEYADKIAVVPHGIHPRTSDDTRREEIRERFGLPESALIVASFGFVHPDKMQTASLDAFARVVPQQPGAMYIFVGEEADGGESRRHAASLGIQDRVRFLGRQPASAFADLMLVTDIGVNLRKPPTNGETSGALLNLLAAGVPSITTDVATFSDYPAHCVRKVHWETEGQDGLNRAMHDLAADTVARETLSRAAWSYVDAHHRWSRVAKLYVEAIERGCSRPGLATSGQPDRVKPATQQAI
jgi:glycosyltransferase involved in cell wall biosynthesis